MLMDTQILTQKIARAKELLYAVNNAAMATVNEDGSPHNTPYFFLIDEALTQLYWSSNEKSLHSLNVARTGEIFVVLYDAFASGGLFIRANHSHVTMGDELDEALAIYNQKRADNGKGAVTAADYPVTGPQRMYKADITNFWTNLSIRDNQGVVVEDIRYELTAKDLL